MIWGAVYAGLLGALLVRVRHPGAPPVEPAQATPGEPIWLVNLHHLPETLTEEETSAEQKPPIGTCCAAAPPVIEFDAQGKVVQGWGQGPMASPQGSDRWTGKMLARNSLGNWRKRAMGAPSVSTRSVSCASRG